MTEQKYPVSTADFERIRIEDYLYVDKTGYIHQLVSSGVFYFLARPRRFGKSLLLSTIEAYFRGKRYLFKGLEIDQLQPEEWAIYPVLRLDMSCEAFIDNMSLTNLLNAQMHDYEESLGISNFSPSSAQRLASVIRTMASQANSKIVVLIDEYDAPLVAAIGNSDMLELYRKQLHGFYSVLKSLETHIQFCMLTGVTKFGKVSVFSGLNNLKDITFSDRYAAICGITEKELTTKFQPGIEGLACKYHCNPQEAIAKLKFNYDGYHFSESLLDIYNPYSLLNALADLRIAPYWCASGIPSLLAKTIRENDYDITSLNGLQISVSTLENISVYSTDPAALFYQAGYLTIKAYDPTNDLFTLGYPNREVEQEILNDILHLFLPEKCDIDITLIKLRESLLKGKPTDFIMQMKAFLAGIPSKLRHRIDKYENYYHTIFYCISTLIGLDTNVEYNTAEGFIDMVIRTSNYIYIIEFKINGTAEKAMQQIETKNYTSPFDIDSRQLYRIGIGFSKLTHTIESYLIR